MKARRNDTGGSFAGSCLGVLDGRVFVVSRWELGIGSYLFFLLKGGKVLLCVLITGRDVEIPLPRTFVFLQIGLYSCGIRREK